MGKATKERPKMTLEQAVTLYNQTTGGVRHEIRPIRMRYLISSFREHEQQSGEVSVLKTSSLTKSVIFVRG